MCCYLRLATEKKVRLQARFKIIDVYILRER